MRIGGRAHPGGILGLADLLTRHGEAVEADLQRFYRTPLTDLGTPALTWRRFRALVRHLPVDSALSRATNGDGMVEWSIVVEQLSQIKHQLQWANWIAAGDKHARKPKPDPRPGQPTPGVNVLGGKLQHPQWKVKAYLDSFSYRPDRDAERVPLNAPDRSEEVTTDGS